MIVAWSTDIHLSFVDRDVFEAFAQRVRDSGARVLLVGGDIAEGPTLEDELRRIAAAIPMPIYFVLGNHDYYFGSVVDIESTVTAMNAPNCHWLERSGVVELSTDTALVGVGGWGDARLGNVDSSPVVLNDFIVIEDLVKTIDGPDQLVQPGGRARLTARLRELGDESARILQTPLQDATARYPNVVVLTHVPPFREASWYDGRISKPDYLPYFACQATGDVIRTTAETNPTCNITVLCGHTHGGGQAQILPNLLVLTAEARYGEPEFQLLEV